MSLRIIPPLWLIYIMYLSGGFACRTLSRCSVPQVGGATASTEIVAVERHTGVHTPVTVAKTILANQQLAYAA